MPVGQSPTLLAKRYELKYRVSEATALAVSAFIRSYLPLDYYSARHASGQYPICSLYLDSRRFNLFYETIFDKCYRYKLRVRGYDQDPNSPLFFEVKRKLNGIVHKSRAQVARDQLAAVLNNSHLPRDLPEKDRRRLKQFLHYRQCLDARPMVLVRYLREAYENAADSRVRITFDRKLCNKTMDRPAFTMNGPGWNRLPIDFVVLEIKFTANFPSWVKDMVRLFDLQRESMSKYCSAVRPLVPDGSTFYRMPRR